MTTTPEEPTASSTAPTDSVPDGFVPHDRPSPVTDPWQPLYRRVAGGSFAIGLRIDTAHCNGRGFLHGGVIAALADNAMGLSAIETLRAGGRPSSGYTLNLSIDYVRRGEIGDWVEFRPTVHKAGRTVSLVDCAVVANDDTLVARATASFMTPAADEEASSQAVSAAPSGSISAAS